MLVDRFSLAGTLALDRIAEHAAEVGAKVVLIGDWAQLSAVETGGAFGMLVRHRDQVPELTDVRRFANEWEKIASLSLRHGNIDALDERSTTTRRAADYSTAAPRRCSTASTKRGALTVTRAFVH